MQMNQKRFNSGYSLFDRKGRAIYSTDFENDPAWFNFTDNEIMKMDGETAVV